MKTMSPAMSRRRLLTLAAQAGAGALIGCATTPPSESSSPGLKVIDTHTHFYDPTRPQGVPWPGRDDKLLYRTVLPRDYKAQVTPRPVTGTVVVEASPWVEDNQWILDLAANDRFIVGFVGNLPAATDAFGALLKRFAANKLFRGIRIGARKDDLSTGSPLLRDLKMLADRDLALDLLGGLEILSFADRLAEQLPTLRIVIDHVANVRIDGKAPPRDWLSQMTSIAKRKNIFCKVSGLVEGTGRTDGSAPRDAQFYAPVLDVLMDRFGAERLIYASNWPVSERFAPLATVQGIVEDYFSARGKETLENIFWRSGKRAYRWS